MFAKSSCLKSWTGFSIILLCVLLTTITYATFGIVLNPLCSNVPNPPDLLRFSGGIEFEKNTFLGLLIVHTIMIVLCICKSVYCDEVCVGILLPSSGLIIDDERSIPRNFSF